MRPVAIAAYTRVSTPQQSEALQREGINRAATARGEPIELWFSEGVASRTPRERPKLDAIRSLARRGEVSKLYVFRLDRLACGAQHLLRYVCELRDNGCAVITLEGIDTRGPWADAILAVLGTAAEIEREALRERTAAARAAAEASGKRWGRPALVDADGKRAKLSQLLEQGWTLRKAASESGLSYGYAQRFTKRGQL